MHVRRLRTELAELTELVVAWYRRRFHGTRLDGQRDVQHRCRAFNHRAARARPLDRTRFVVLDTETTGVEPYAGDELVEVALLEYRGLIPTGRELCSLVRPGRAIPLASTRIHGITTEDVAEAPPIADLLPAIVDFVDNAVLVGHEVAFDLRFLNRATRQVLYCRLANPAIDTNLLYQAWARRLGHHALEDVADRCGVPVHQRHRARGDALTCGSIFRRLVPRLVGPRASVGDLLAIGPPRLAYGPDHPAAGRPPADGPPPPR